MQTNTEKLYKALEPWIIETHREDAKEVIKAHVKEESRLGWQTKDIHYQANQLNLKLTEEEAEEVMSHLEDNFDANIGVNWFTISQTIGEYEVGQPLTDEEKKQESSLDRPIIVE